MGLAAGLAFLPLTAYRRITPLWLRSLLIGSSLLMVGRYVTLALFTQPEAPLGWMSLRTLWLGSSVGLTLPSVFAVDQLLRHPAMTPQKLLKGFAPFLAIYALLMLFAPVSLVPDRVAGWALQLAMPWQVLLSLTQAIFTLGFLAACALFIRKIPTPAIRRALIGLVAAHAYLGVDGLVMSWGGWYFRPFLFSEMLALAALWHAYETAWQLQQSGISLSG